MQIDANYKFQFILTFIRARIDTLQKYHRKKFYEDSVKNHRLRPHLKSLRWISLTKMGLKYINALECLILKLIVF